MLQLLQNPNFDIIGKRRYAFIFSLALIVLSVVAIIARGGLIYGIDFTGGNLVQIRTERPVDIADIRSVLLDMGIKAEVQDFGSPQDFVIKYKEELDASKIVERLRAKLGVDVQKLRVEKVGPKVGKELQHKATVAVTIGLLLMLLYITVRFDFRFGLGSVIALFHDVFITLGIFTLLGKEITVEIVAAFLTIVGYSINDSIVVSDRVRENLKKIGKVVRADHFVEVVNRSINETLSRTLITSLTTLLVLISVLIFGGPVIFDFAFALTVGVIVGTYSSIFVVAALVVEWRLYRERKKLATAPKPAANAKKAAAKPVQPTAAPSVTTTEAPKVKSVTTTGITPKPPKRRKKKKKRKK